MNHLLVCVCARAVVPCHQVDTMNHLPPIATAIQARSRSWLLLSPKNSQTQRTITVCDTVTSTMFGLPNCQTNGRYVKPTKDFHRLLHVLTQLRSLPLQTALHSTTSTIFCTRPFQCSTSPNKNHLFGTIKSNKKRERSTSKGI